MIRKIVSWLRNNPALVLLTAFIVGQMFINVVLFIRIDQLQEALRELVLKLYPPYPTYRF